MNSVILGELLSAQSRFENIVDNPSQPFQQRLAAWKRVREMREMLGQSYPVAVYQKNYPEWVPAQTQMKDGPDWEAHVGTVLGRKITIIRPLSFQIYVPR